MITQVGDTGTAFMASGAPSPELIAEASGGMHALSACVQRTGIARLALAQQGFEVTGLAVRKETIIACRLGGDGRSEVWRINGAQRHLLASVAWPLAQDSPVLEFQAFEEACLIYPSLLPRRRSELRAQMLGIPILRVMPDGTTREAWIDWGDWNAEGGYRVTRAVNGLAVGILHGWTEAGERYSGLWRRAAGGWLRVAVGQLDPGSLGASPNGRWLTWREQRQQPAGAPRRFRYNVMLLGTGAP